MPAPIPCEHNPVKLCKDCRLERKNTQRRTPEAKAKTAEYDREKRAANLEELRRIDREKKQLWRAENYDEYREYQNTYRAEHPEYARTQNECARLWRLMNEQHIREKKGMRFPDGVTPASLRLSQNNLCKKCGIFMTEQVGRKTRKGSTRCTDHDHTTGWVRGLLCHNCNAGIGMLGDNWVGVQAAADYLKAFEQPFDTVWDFP